MLLVILRVVYLSVCAGAILAYINPEEVEGPASSVPATVKNVDGNRVVVVEESTPSLPRIIRENKLWAFILLLLLTQIVTICDVLIPKKRIEVISAIYFGILVGVLLAYLMTQALTPVVKPPYTNMAVMISLLIFPYICVSLLLQTKDDFRFVIPYVEFARDLKGGRPLVVDSSSLIDGRIADVVETQILESQLVVPDFVLAEVQEIADSNDKNRRIRGRRGLEVLATMQKSPHTEIRVHETNRNEFRSMAVDHKIVELAKQLRGGVITNDFNLNKVASVQGISVINLNDVASALRPRFIPGERLRIKIIKEGESPGQGVGYLDDGTMVVCEGTASRIGAEVDSIVSSVLQSSAGRMIFAKPVHNAT